jgi:hypothetical protein
MKTGEQSSEFMGVSASSKVSTDLDLGPSVAKWGQEPWPSALGDTVKRHESLRKGSAKATDMAPNACLMLSLPSMLLVELRNITVRHESWFISET